MGHSHPHHNHEEGNIKVAFFLNFFFSIIELIGGLWTNSVAILSDALHDLGDSFTLGASWYFAKIARKKRDHQFSYGYKRFSVLGALINAMVLVTGSILILLEAIPRLFNPVNPRTEEMIYLAIGGVLINSIAAIRLRKGHSLNEKVVFTHLLEDVLGWAAVLAGAIVMHFTYLPILDPVLSIAIALFILVNIYRSLKESFRIILQGTPPSIKISDIQETILQIPEVVDTHDCHAWSMDGTYNILSIHVVVENDLPIQRLEYIKRQVKTSLLEKGIHHTTIEFETEGENCDPC